MVMILQTALTPFGRPKSTQFNLLDPTYRSSCGPLAHADCTRYKQINIYQQFVASIQKAWKKSLYSVVDCWNCNCSSCYSMKSAREVHNKHKPAVSQLKCSEWPEASTLKSKIKIGIKSHLLSPLLPLFPPHFPYYPSLFFIPFSSLSFPYPPLPFFLMPFMFHCPLRLPCSHTPSAQIGCLWECCKLP